MRGTSANGHSNYKMFVIQPGMLNLYMQMLELQNQSIYKHHNWYVTLMRTSTNYTSVSRKLPE